MSRKRWKSLLASALLTAVAIVVDGCSSGDNTGGPTDGGTEATHPAQHKDASASFTDEGGTGDGSAAFDGTTGQKCTMDADCSPSGLGLNKCSTNLFQGGPVFPTAVCLMSTPCDPGTDNFIHYCDGPDRPTSPGICIPQGTGGTGTCFPRCVIPSNGTPVVGCQGKDACGVFGWGQNQSGVVAAVGYCAGGCAADSDCPTGSQCEKESGLCLTMPTPPTNKLGQPCSANDPAGTCNCYQNLKTGIGYCTQFCTVGAAPSQCPSGYVCDSDLPAQIIASNDAAVTGFTMQNSGLAGVCLQVCGNGGGANDAGGANDSGLSSDAVASTSEGGDSASDGGAPNDSGAIPASDSGAAPSGACPVTASCSTRHTAGPDCIP